MNKATEHGPYTYNYDSLYRLTRADGGPLTAESYSYDPVGNRLTSSSANNWTYNPNNELQSYNGVTFQYDLNGKTIQKNDNGTIQNFLFNEDDRLTEVTDGTGAEIATYYYDPFGRRLWKEVGGDRTYFIYADEGLIAEFDGTGSFTKGYGYAPNSTWTTNPLFMKQSSEYDFYHNDHIGTPQMMTSVTGAVVWSAYYESFGKAVIDSFSSIENNLRFPGQYYDVETGLHYNYHRYYDPRTGRYLTPDPIGLAGGHNVFQYAHLTPLNNSDPRGLICQSEEREAIGPLLYRDSKTEPIAYYKALVRSVASKATELYLKLKKVTTPPIPAEIEKKLFGKYRVRYTIIERYMKAWDIYYVCYDDCTGQVVSSKYLGRVVSPRQIVEVVTSAYEVTKYIGDESEYGWEEVDPTIIKE